MRQRGTIDQYTALGQEGPGCHTNTHHSIVILVFTCSASASATAPMLPIAVPFKLKKHEFPVTNRVDTGLGTNTLAAEW